MLGKELQSEGLLWVGNAMIKVLIRLCVFVRVQYIRVVVDKQILYPGKDEGMYNAQQTKKVDYLGKE